MRSAVIANGFQILQKNKFRVSFMILVMSICLCLTGAAFSKNEEAASAKSRYMETYGTRVQYATGELLPDSIYLNFLNTDNSADYQKLSEFIKSLENAGEFSFVSLSRQPVEMVNMEVPDIFLYNYEDGYAETNKNVYEGVSYYSVKSIQVSASFFEEYPVSVTEGSEFEAEDYIRSKDESELPVLLGKAWKDVLSIGDTAEGCYLGERMTFRVTGFLGDDCYFYNRASAEGMESLERYIVLPAFIGTVGDSLDRCALIDRLNGFIFSSDGYDMTKEVFEQYLEDAGLKGWGIQFLYEKESIELFESYSAMTAEISGRFRSILILTLLFAFGVNAVVLCGMLRDHFNTFGVELLCGASLRDIAMESCTASSAVSITADLIASPILLVNGYSAQSLLLVQLVSLLILIGTCVICMQFVKKMELGTYLGGKE